jgi:hypothetical protein
MNTNFEQATAKIYQFPVGGRAALAARQTGPKTAVDITTPRVNEASCGSGWYHEAAIEEEAKRTGEH